MKAALIVAHGSDDDSTSAAEIQAKRLEARLGTRVAYVYKDHGRDEMRATLMDLTSEGADEVVVLPLFVSAGQYSDVTVPKMVGLGEGEKAGTVDLDGRRIKVRVARPFGNDPMLNGVLGTVLSRGNAEPGRTGVLVIGHGSPDGSSARAIGYCAAIVEGLGYDSYACYNEMTAPGIEETLRKAIADGHDDILAIPIFVSPSVHTTVEVPAKLGLSAGKRERAEMVDGRRCRIRYAPEIGLEPGIADILYKMVNE